MPGMMTITTNLPVSRSSSIQNRQTGWTFDRGWWCLSLTTDGGITSALWHHYCSPRCTNSFKNEICGFEVRWWREKGVGVGAAANSLADETDLFDNNSECHLCSTLCRQEKRIVLKDNSPPRICEDTRLGVHTSQTNSQISCEALRSQQRCVFTE